GNVFYYVRELKNSDVVERYARDIKEGWWDRCVFRRGLLGLTVGTVALCGVIGLWPGLLAAGIHAVMYVFVLSSSINGLCHHVGYKNFPNTATNIRSLALLTGGEGLHNNHHGYPRSPKFSFRASEIDPAWPVIRLIVALNLAKPYKTIEEVAAVERKISQRRPIPGGQTLAALTRVRLRSDLGLTLVRPPGAGAAEADSKREQQRTEQDGVGQRIGKGGELPAVCVQRRQRSPQRVARARMELGRNRLE